MRKIIAGLFISLDGVVEAPEKWTGPYFNACSANRTASWRSRSPARRPSAPVWCTSATNPPAKARPKTGHDLGAELPSPGTGRPSSR